MLGYYDNKLCIPARELVGEGIITLSNYKAMSARGRIKVARRGGGAKNSCALVVVDSLPAPYREQVEEKFGCDEARITAWVMSNYELDQAAVVYYTDWAASHRSDHATIELARKYAVNASVLNTCIRLYERGKEREKLMGDKYDWSKMAKVIETLREQLGHDLPASTLRFRRKVCDYKKYGYACLISEKFGNQCARKVDYKTERLILGIAVLPNKPFNTNVLEMYNSFVCGELEVYDPETGELFNPDDFTDKNGEPLVLSESTIVNYLNKPKNKVLIHHALEDWETFMHEDRPHVHRHDGEFSLSQITADDVDLSRKMADTKKRVHAYYMYDDLSQCVIGAAYGRKKDQMLVVECFRDMFRTLDRNGWGMPAGIEVENHLMSEYKGGFLQAGVAFSFVHFCAPLNSQEKHSESFNGAKKRSIIHKNHEGIGRFYGKGKWRMKSKKISDEENDTYEDKKYYSYEELVADDMADNREWNNSLHPNQKKYPGMTRWQVLEANINPTLERMDKLTLSRYIGEKVPTTIRRNSTVRVAHEDWWLSGPEVLEQLQPNDYKVDAYYLPDDNGNPTDVYLFQGERYIDKVERVETYNRVMAEQTDEDVAIYIDQQKRISKFDKYVRDNKISKVAKATPTPTVVEETEDDIVLPLPTMPDDPEDYEWKPDMDNTRRAFEDL